MSLKLVYLGKFETEFKGNKYVIYQFLHPNSMTILSGTNLEFPKDLILDNDYTCEIAYKNNKIKVIGILQ